MLLDLRAAVDHPLFDLTHHHLHFEVAGVLLGDFFQPVEDGSELGQMVDLVNLLVQSLKFLDRGQVFRAHKAIVH